jgi:hypothetical protein
MERHKGEEMGGKDRRENGINGRNWKRREREMALKIAVINRP